MTNFEWTLLQGVARLPKLRRADVLAFIRFLRLSSMDDAELERSYDDAIAKIRETAKRCNITEKDVEEEVHAVRESYACGGCYQ